MNYLVISRFEVNNANAQPAWWMIGPPPLTAYAGFSHALALALGLARCRGFGVVHHDIQFLGEMAGGDFRPHQFRAASFIDKDDYSSKNPYALSSQPSARCHLTVSLVIRFDEDDGLDLEDTLPRFLRGARLAGGNIVKYGKIVLLGNLDEAAKSITNGYSILERQDLMIRQEGERDMLDVVLRLTDPQRRRADPEAPSWLLPTTLGYRAITPFQQRKNVRGDLPHAYAEPLVGMVQYRTLREAPLPIWQTTNPDASTFLVTTQP
jgi:CRISPR-associated protein Csy2